MTSGRVPSIFVSHGLPPIVLIEDEYSESLRNFGQALPPLKGIIALSSHWMNPGPLQITSSKKPQIEKNFYGYQEELYELQYNPPGSPELAERVADLLYENGFEAVPNDEAGLDHGVWLPLLRIRPEADVPVIQISLPMLLPSRNVMKIGHALSSLREEGYLLMGSGAAAFNPTKIIWSAGTGNVNQKIAEFDRWLRHQFMGAQVEEILNYEELGPNAKFAHPGKTNLLPLMFIMGTSLPGDGPGIIFHGFRYHSQSLLTLELSQNLRETRLELSH